MITISLCMIVKNEESTLERCLNSYNDIYDELVIVDTGSTDRTKEIAARYTDKIYDFEWCNDFSAARNYAFSLASCDYIYSADADEVLDEKNKNMFLDVKQVLLPEIDIVQMYYVNVDLADHNTEKIDTVYNCKKEYRPKLFKRLRTFRWKSPIHETVRLDPVVYDSEIEILHMPTSSHKNRDLEQFLSLLQNQIHLEDYCMIMLCKELYISGTDEDFLSFAELFKSDLLDQYTDPICQENILCILAKIYRLQNDTDHFMSLCMKMYAANPCAELCLEIGLYYEQKQMFEEAVFWYHNAENLSCFIDVRANGILAFQALSRCYSLLASQAQLDHNQALYETYYGKVYQYYRQADAWTLPEVNE